MIYYWITVAFILGTVVGSFLNVVIARMPMEKSLLWPGSRCGSCFQAIRWFDNIPLFSYLFLRGRCRACGQKFSMAYLNVELITGLCFAGLFYLEVIGDVHHFNLPTVRQFAGFPWDLRSLAGCAFHAVLLSFLIAASGCDLRGREIPFPLMLTGTMIGLVGATFISWPWPTAVVQRALPRGMALPMFEMRLPEGIYAWPLWWPLPAWLPINSWQLGLANGLAGMLVGTFLLRSIAFIFGKGLGKEGLGLGDADLMMMAGSFLGWQMVVVAFFVSVVPGMFFGFIQMVVRKDNSLPFGPSLALGTMATCLGWRWLPSGVQSLFFWGQMLLGLAGAAAAFLLITSLFLRFMHRLKG